MQKMAQSHFLKGLELTGSRKSPQNQDKFVVRLPEGMRDELKAAAKANQRTMNAEVVARLEGWHRLLDEVDHLKQGALHLNTEIDRLKEAVRDEKIRADRAEERATRRGGVKLEEGVDYHLTPDELKELIDYYLNRLVEHIPPVNFDDADYDELAAATPNKAKKSDKP
ncbi:Arc family DNA-binding protein [Acuticoccus sp. M5D2P5]|uniref:Arc family DNA-binding protein n=1 Tax=Acuticoccus kalidii TaxID=2910977 RepID=UPI001F42AA01|nr:Arc family DNA-binding protein [Acuticoccus kalidii]MCF3934309.1 Arc family DNA-binding protein [Acuticoccus kalidii]